MYDGNMNTETPQDAAVDTLVTLGVVELLLNPEFAGDWLSDFAESIGVTLTDEQDEYLNDTVIRTLTELAVPFVQSLPDDQRPVYEDVLRQREQALHPLTDTQVSI